MSIIFFTYFLASYTLKMGCCPEFRNILLDLKEEGFLRRLSRAVKWAGRYPAPLSFKELMAEEYSNGKKYMESFFTKGEIKEVKKLLSKLLEA